MADNRTYVPQVETQQVLCKGPTSSVPPQSHRCNPCPRQQIRGNSRSQHIINKTEVVQPKFRTDSASRSTCQF